MNWNQNSSVGSNHPWRTHARRALCAGAVAFGLGAASSTQAQVIYAEDFNAPDATAASVGWQQGVDYPSSGGVFAPPSVVQTGIAGSGTLECSVSVTDASTLSGYAEYPYWADLPAGASSANLSLTADVTGSRSGAPFALTLDDHLGHTIVFHSHIGTAGQFQTVGGRLGEASSVDPAFQFQFGSVNGYSIIVAFEADPAWGSGAQSLKIDNVVLKSVASVGPILVQDFEAPGATAWGGGGINAGGDSLTRAITPTGGVGGSNAMVTSFNVTSPTTFNGWSEYWSGTLTLPPGSDAYSLMLTVQVTGSKAGQPFSLKINDHGSPSKTTYFNGTVGTAGVFQQIGGRLSTANSVGSGFNYASTAGYSIILSFNQDTTGNAWNLGTNTLTIDNVVLQSIERREIGYLRNFNAPGATPSSEGWASGGISAGGDTRTVTVSPAGGVGGSGALVTSVNVTAPTLLSLWTEAWSGSMKLPTNSTVDSLYFTAQVTANRSGVPFSLKISDHGSPTAHYITFDGTVAVAGVFQPLGGRLADASAVDPNFNFASTGGYSLMVTMNSSANWDTGTATLTLDEVKLERVVPGASFPVSLARQSGQSILTWPSNAGQDYAVQFKDSLNDPAWFKLASPTRATGATSSFTNNPIGSQSRFYRIYAE